ncbi:MAG: aldo/keto reductase [Candidatus Zixiibacteriota bacterium]|nr:MAG: aldo/keto reductase [candidate division Zixibacteria bacterium]
MSEKKSNLSRRGFLTTAASGLVSSGLLSLAPDRAFSLQAIPDAEQPEKAIIKRKLSPNGPEVPIVSMGVLSANNPEMIQAAYEAGIRHFSTSAYYQFGRNEMAVGNVVNRLKVRDKVVIATGVSGPGHRRGLTEAGAKNELIAACEASLERLGTDYIDILYVYEIENPETVGNEGIMEGMRILKQQGKVRYGGISTHTRMTEIINAAIAGGFYEVVLTAINFTLADDTALLNAIKTAAEKGIAIIAMKTLAYGGRWPNESLLKDFSGTTVVQAALKWVMRNENICTCIPGFMNYDHLREDFSVAYDLEYTDEEKKFLSDKDVILGIGFCRQCRKCVASCPEGVDLPKLVRSHVYAAQYGDFQLSRATLDDVSPGAGLDNCRDCMKCQARCAHTVDIARRIAELKTIYC